MAYAAWAQPFNYNQNGMVLATNGDSITVCQQISAQTQMPIKSFMNDFFFLDKIPL